jgi:hypothetical protein
MVSSNAKAAYNKNNWFNSRYQVSLATFATNYLFAMPSSAKQLQKKIHKNKEKIDNFSSSLTKILIEIEE